MGACLSNTTNAKEDAELIRSKHLDKEIREDEKQRTKEAKLLLLGPGDSGKSTILRSMRLIHSVSFTSSEIENYRKLIFSNNLLDGIRSILDLMEEEKIPFSNSKNIKSIQFVIKKIDLNDFEPFPEEYFEILQNLWNDENLQRTLTIFGSQSGIPENVYYYFNELERLFERDYKPNNQDILHCRNKTIGIVETRFPTVNDKIYRIFDVGGQRSERKKWIHCFENVDGVFFIIAISGYNCYLSEDKNQNQMNESLNLFGSICNSPWFTKTSMILFLNKIDIFKNKIQNFPIKNHFPDYLGNPTDFDQSKLYFKNRFLRLNRSKTKDVYPYFTNATDPNLLKVVMVTVNDIIISNHLRGSLL